jgi:hypothetical protein
MKKIIVKTWEKAFKLDAQGIDFYVRCFQCKKLRHSSLVYTWDDNGAKCKLC